MIKTRTKPVCKNHFNLSSKEIHQYRKYILNLVNRRWMKQKRKISTDNCKIRFSENQIHHFKSTEYPKYSKQREISLPKKGILKKDMITNQN